MIQELLKANGDLLLPLALLVATTTLAKGLFGVLRSRSQDRKDFLELWRAVHPDDLWTEVAVRHLVGEYLPATVIRSLRTSPQAGRALIEVARSWPLLEIDDETSEIRWRHDRYSTPKRRRAWWWIFGTGYFLLFGGGLLTAYFLLVAPTSPPINWLYPAIGVVTGLCCLNAQERLQTAGIAVPRWLGLP